MICTVARARQKLGGYIMRTRLESDSIGTMEVPEDAYYGVQALRAEQMEVKTAM